MLTGLHANHLHSTLWCWAFLVCQQHNNFTRQKRTLGSRHLWPDCPFEAGFAAICVLLLNRSTTRPWLRLKNFTTPCAGRFPGQRNAAVEGTRVLWTVVRSHIQSCIVVLIFAKNISRSNKTTKTPGLYNYRIDLWAKPNGRGYCDVN